MLVELNVQTLHLPSAKDREHVAFDHHTKMTIIIEEDEEELLFVPNP